MIVYTKNYCLFYTALIGFSVILSVLLSILLKDKNEKIKKIPASIISFTILFLEIIKQIYNATGFNCTNILAIFQGDRGNYSAWSLPFHFCSMFSVLLLLTQITKGKVKKTFETMAFFCSAIISTAIIFLPKAIWGGSIDELIEGRINYLSHTIIYHTLVFLYFTIEFGLHTTEFKKENFWQGALMFPIYASIAMPAAFIFDTNYCSFLEPIQVAEYFDFFTSKGLVFYEISYTIIATIVCVGFYILISVFRNAENSFHKTITKIGFLVFGLLNFGLFFLDWSDGQIANCFLILEILLLFISLLPGFLKNKKPMKAKNH